MGDELPETVINQYHIYIGGWILPPFWAMGYHQMKWNGYISTEAFENVLMNYEKYSLPLDSLWSDLEYMKGSINFSIDEERYDFKKIKELFEKYQKKWIPVLDAYLPFDSRFHYLMIIQIQ